MNSLESLPIFQPGTKQSLRGFPVNFAKFLRTAFLTEHLRWLLLEYFRNNKKSGISSHLKVLQRWVVLNFDKFLKKLHDGIRFQQSCSLELQLCWNWTHQWSFATMFFERISVAIFEIKCSFIAVSFGLWYSFNSKTSPVVAVSKTGFVISG